MGMGLTGAGGAGGAANAIAKILAQRLLDAKLQEESRANQTDEENRAANTKLAQQSRADILAETERQHKTATSLRQVQSLSKGTRVGDETFKRLTDPDTGAAFPEQFDTNQGTPSSLKSVSMAGMMPLDRGEPSTMNATPRAGGTVIPTTHEFQGTAEQNSAAEKEARLGEQTDAAISAKVESLKHEADRLEMQGKLNEANILLAQADAALKNAQADKTTKGGITLSAGGKANAAAIEQAGPLTDQAMKMMEEQFPDIATNPEKYNSTLDKLSSIYDVTKYKLGFADPNDPRRQIVSLLQPIQAGQYMRSSRSRQMLELALKHMADITQTPAAQYDRLKQLRAIMPEMREGLIRAEMPVDPNNPLAGSYFDPANSSTGTGQSAPPAPPGWKYVPKAGGGWTAVEDKGEQ